MIRWAALCVAAFALASPAWSLSCLPSDIARDYARAAEADESYVVVMGNLYFDQEALPRRDPMSNQRLPRETDIPAWLDGHSLTPDGFTRRFERDVTLRIECRGPWCGGAVTGPYIVFLKKHDQSFILHIGPCGNMAYSEPTPVQIETVTACMQGARCVSD